MSYAQQFFGNKQNQVLNYADNLAWFGKESYVYSNSDMMLEVIKNPIAMSNPNTALYAYFWARENDYTISELFQVGQIISIYQNDLDRNLNFVLANFNDDGSATFISTEPLCAAPLSSAATQAQVLKYTDYDFVQYLNGDLNWWYNWKDKPASVTSQISQAYYTSIYKLKKLNGFLYGLDDEIRNKLLSFVENENLVCLPVEYNDLATNGYMMDNYVRKPKLVYSTPAAYKFTCMVNDLPEDSNYKPNKTFWGHLIKPFVSADELGTNYGFRGGIIPYTPYLVDHVKEGGMAGTVPSIAQMANIAIKIKM